MEPSFFVYVRKAKHPHYKAEEARLASYPPDWRWGLMTAKDFVIAGFFHLETHNNCLQCHWCGAIIKLRSHPQTRRCFEFFHHEMLCLYWLLFRPKPETPTPRESSVDGSDDHESECLDTSCRYPKIDLYLFGCHHVVSLCPKVILAIIESCSLGPKDDDVDLGGAGTPRPSQEEVTHDAVIVCPTCGVGSVHLKRVFFNTNSNGYLI